VWRNTANDSTTATQINTTPVTSLSYLDTTAVAGTTYYYWVKAGNSLGDSAFSAGDSGALSAVTTAPAILQEAGSGGLVLNAAPGTDDSHGAPSLATDLGTAAGQIEQGTLNTAEELDWYSFTMAATGNGVSVVTLSFTRATGNLKILLYSDPLNSGPTRYGTVGVDCETISLDGLAPGTYYVRVYGYNPQSYNLTVTAPAAPAAPTGVQASAGSYNNGILVTWAASTGATSYSVYRSTTNDISTATPFNSVTSLRYFDTGTVAATTYYYWVKATNSLGSNVSASVFGTLGNAGATPAVIQESGSHGSPDSATAIGTAAGQTVLGAMGDANELDWYSFTLGAAGGANSSVVLSFTRLTGDLRTLLYSDPFHAGPMLYGTAGADNETISMNGLAAGTYYLRVYGYAANDYMLRVTA
jgi:cellulose 1,4-beta-cellobiosidase